MVEFTDGFLTYFLLFLMYMLQGISRGITTTVPMLFRDVAYNKQALFSFVSWPLSIKILWAPIIDAVHTSYLGRRKSWIVPCELACGLFLLLLSWDSELFSYATTTDAHVYKLTAAFFIYNILMASHDTAVDGWVLTLFRRESLAYASACNSFGNIVGFVLSHGLLLSLTSKEFCNNYLRSTQQKGAIITFQEYLVLLATLHFTVALAIIIFTREERNGLHMSVVQAYKKIYELLLLPPVQKLGIILLTGKIAFATAEVYKLKLIETGASCEILALLNLPLLPFEVLSAFITSKFIHQKPLNILLTIYPLRMVVGPLLAFLVKWLCECGGVATTYFYFTLFLTLALSQVCAHSMNVAIMAFTNLVSNPDFGATYITLLNTAANLGSRWPATLALLSLDILSIRKHSSSVFGYQTDEMYIDGLYIETALCFVIGIFWYVWGWKKIKEIQETPLSAWR